MEFVRNIEEVADLMKGVGMDSSDNAMTDHSDIQRLFAFSHRFVRRVDMRSPGYLDDEGSVAALASINACTAGATMSRTCACGFLARSTSASCSASHVSGRVSPFSRYSAHSGRPYQTVGGCLEPGQPSSIRRDLPAAGENWLALSGISA